MRLASRVGVVALLLLAAPACASRRPVEHCEIRYLPIAWVDGAASLMTISYCGMGSMRIVPTKAPR